MTWWPRTWMRKSKKAPGSPSSSGGRSPSPSTVHSRPSGPPQRRSMRRSLLSLSTSPARSSQRAAARAIGRQGLTIIIATEKTVIIIDAGKKRTITTTGQTLADALAAAKITVDRTTS